MAIKSICVYCGANFNGDPKLKAIVEELAAVLVDRGIELIYGGGSVGVMGLIADAVLLRGGRVTGVIPKFLLDKEVEHKSVTNLFVTDNMHQRKQKMADLADGFIILPGGFGTLEEFFEVLTWLQLGLHGKSIGVLNVDGFYDHLFAQMDVMVERRFLKQSNREMVLSDDKPVALVEKMLAFKAVPEEVWFRDRDLT
ncbi:TIGR00730 family Rossman fold protein [Desertivirga arenae]|uniref:LOG family protein n=1 Tax=Desertivirga arenae TaxID=2810309 RepID=UPI001A978EB6|nr:TIGR00730 family Rossman fold protein [Pedobacter sp. SYSU D00823]